MNVQKIKVNPRAAQIHDDVEQTANALVRGFDRTMAFLHLGGRKGDYDDVHYEFVGGAKDDLRRKHYDKSLRFLWKAEKHAPWSSFKDCTAEERALLKMAEQSLASEERAELHRIGSTEFREMLNATYTPREKQALVNVLALIGHGEAYAWLVSTEVLNEVKSTGGRAALTMQVFEEAKHFVVLRELIQAFECPIPRLSAWEYILLERGFKSKGLEKFFAMNIVVEGFALSLFGMLSAFPGLEILRLFHLDESRHAALPSNYFKEFPMSLWERHSPFRKFRRLSLVLPALPVMMQLESDLAELGIDSFDFGGAMTRKLLHLSERVGFHLPFSTDLLFRFVNALFNTYCKFSRDGHRYRDFVQQETTRGRQELEVERKVFELERPSPDRN